VGEVVVGVGAVGVAAGVVNDRWHPSVPSTRSDVTITPSRDDDDVDDVGRITRDMRSELQGTDGDSELEG
jgi:hypothetical protein